MSKKSCFNQFILIVLFFISQITFSQLVIDAGEDTTLCNHNDSIIIGGNPTAKGGIVPYIYKWTTYSALSGQEYPTRFLLSDSSVSNPIFSNNIDAAYPISDIVIVRLKVTDSLGNSEFDSIKIGFSAILHRTALGCWFNVNSGDSVRVRVCNRFYGLKPFSYRWTPEEFFSDPYSQDPYIKPDTSMTIRVELTDTLGCKAWENYSVYVTPIGINTRLNSQIGSLVFPNPVTDRSEITIRNETNTTLQIKIFDSQARLVVSAYFSNDSFQVGEFIQNSGVYYYTISQDSKLISNGKFIKN